MLRALADIERRLRNAPVPQKKAQKDGPARTMGSGKPSTEHWTVPRQIEVSVERCDSPLDTETAQGTQLPAVLDVGVHAELVRMGTQTKRVDLILRLVPDPSVDHVGREDVTPEQEVVVVP